MAPTTPVAPRLARVVLGKVTNLGLIGVLERPQFLLGKEILDPMVGINQEQT